MAESIYTRTYRDFRGVDFSSKRSECDPSRFNDLVNMWRDYRSEQGAAVETSPGFREVRKGSGKVHAIHYLPDDGENGDCLIVHEGRRLIAYRNGTQVLENEMEERRSSSMLFFHALYLIDGKHYYRIRNGKEVTVDPVDAYVPITFLNGTAYEQRNLLTDEFIEKYSEEYTVDKDVFYLRNMVYAYDGRHIYAEDESGLLAVKYCAATDPSEIVDSFVETVEYYDQDGAPIEVTYSSYKKQILPNVTIYKGVAKTTWRPEPPTQPVVYETPFVYYVEKDGSRRPIIIIGTKELADAAETGFYWETTEIEGEVFLNSLKRSDTNDLSIQGYLEIHGFSAPNKFATVGNFRDALTGNPDFAETDVTALDAILGCTLLTEFDGRIFFSGNPKLPNSIFYTQRDLTGYNNPFYIGAYNYLNDGTGRTPVTAMISTPTQLIVLKDDAPQGSNIYYHYAQDNPAESQLSRDLQPRIYPRENGVPGIGCVGMAANFRDDPVFLSPRGLEAVGKSQVNLERTLVHRSSLVDGRLINEDLRGAVAVEWEGYLCILVPGGRMYLADSRQLSSIKNGGTQYEWYHWDDIGVWDGQETRYLYLTGNRYGAPEKVVIDSAEYYTAVKSGDESFTEGKVHAFGQGDEKYYCVLEEDNAGETCAFLVAPTEEYDGGTFKQATALLAVGESLLFGCEDGTICIFNTDMRDKDHRLPPESYHHNGRRYFSGCATTSDDCGRTNLVKSTIKNSLVIATKSFPYALVTVDVRTNAEPQRECDRVYAGEYDEAHTNFAVLAFNPNTECIAVVREREKRWVEKQLYFYAECFESPFGILSITYDYKVAGRYRNK